MTWIMLGLAVWDAALTVALARHHHPIRPRAVRSPYGPVRYGLVRPPGP